MLVGAHSSDGALPGAIAEARAVGAMFDAATLLEDELTLTAFKQRARDADLIHLAAHEVYPGHHTEHAVKEQLLIRERGAIEEGIQLVPTPQAVVSEGIAETGSDIALDGDGRAAAYRVLAHHGFALDPGLTERIWDMLEKLRTVSLDAALMIHDGGASPAEAQAYIERWGLVPPEQARHSISFVTDPTWRAYVVTYSAGLNLCRAYVNGDPARFHTLLTQHVRVGELQASL